MSYFYVDSTIGTRTTGGGTTKQTGSFDSLGAANCYATRTLAIIDGAGSGDIIVCALRHNQQTASNITVAGPTTGDFLTTVVAENANCDTYAVATAANETATVSKDILVSGRQCLHGLWQLAEDDNILSTNSQLLAYDCTFEATGSSDVLLSMPQDGIKVDLVGPTFKGVAGTVPFYFTGGSLLCVWGGVVESGPTVLTSGGFITGGGAAKFVGTDLSNLTGAIISNVGGAATADDLIDVSFFNCFMAASFSWTNENFTKRFHRLSAFNCANTAATAEYQFYIQAMGGYVDDQADSGIHRDETTAFPSGAKVSAHIVTNTAASLAAPFSFELPSISADLSSASTDTLRFYLASTVALDDTDFWIEAAYKDGTNGHKLNLLTTRNSENLTEASAGVALTSDTGSTWKNGASDLTGYNEYYIDVDTSGDVGADGTLLLKFCAAIASTVIYLDPIPDIVA